MAFFFFFFVGIFEGEINVFFFLIENQWCFYYYDWHSFDPKRDGLSKLSNQSFIDKSKLIL